MPRPSLASFLLASLLLSGCVAVTHETRTWSDPSAPPAGWARNGRVETVQETVRRYQGDPAGGAVAGAVVGGLLGHALWGSHGVGTLFGAASGAAVGAAASQGGAEERFYDVLVRFEDGGVQRFTYRDRSPFQPGDYVTLTPQGLSRPAR